MKREILRTLLERMRCKTAINRFFVRNACAKHGTPCDDSDIDVSLDAMVNWLPMQAAGVASGDSSPGGPEQTASPAPEPPKPQPHQDVPPQPSPRPSPQPSPQPAAPPAPQPTQQADPSGAKKMSTAKKALATLAAIGGIGGTAATGWFLGQGSDNQPVQSQPDHQATQRQPWQSPFQFLEDEGAHIP